jgi:hypothetical protein
MCVATVIAAGAGAGAGVGAGAGGAGPKHALSATHVNSTYVNAFHLGISKYYWTSHPVLLELRTRKTRVSVLPATAESMRLYRSSSLLKARQARQ